MKKLEELAADAALGEIEHHDSFYRGFIEGYHKAIEHVVEHLKQEVGPGAPKTLLSAELLEFANE